MLSLRPVYVCHWLGIESVRVASNMISCAGAKIRPVLCQRHILLPYYRQKIVKQPRLNHAFYRLLPLLSYRFLQDCQPFNFILNSYLLFYRIHAILSADSRTGGLRVRDSIMHFDLPTALREAGYDRQSAERIMRLHTAQRAIDCLDSVVSVIQKR